MLWLSILLAILGLLDSRGAVPVHDNGFSGNSNNHKCDKVASLAAWKDQHTIWESSTGTLAGVWMSEGCETRPGPEYILRHYTFNHEGKYELIQHHYWDDSCSSPKLSIVAHGRIQLRNSLVQPGSSNGLARPTNVTITPQDTDAITELKTILQKECPEQKWNAWHLNEPYLVFNREDPRPTYNLWSQINNYQPISRLQATSGPFHCLGHYKHAFNELKLLKVLLRPNSFRVRDSQYEMELLLGDLHSRRSEVHSPTSFQTPLLRVKGNPVVTVRGHNYTITRPGHFLSSATLNNVKTPPHLNEKPHLPPYLWGEWISTRCEVRPLGVYLLRRFNFDEESFTWTGDHKFYGDPFCSYPKFTVTAYGSFALKGPSGTLKGASNLDLDIQRATLTALEEQVIRDMGLPGFCGVGKWRVNHPMELGPTNGCISLGLIVPTTRFDVVKVEMDFRGSWLLYLGQSDTNNMPTDERPTAFELPMVKCGDSGVLSDVNSWMGFLRGHNYESGSDRRRTKSLMFVVLLVWVVNFVAGR